MARVLRGEIRWAELDPTRGNERAGQRPVLVLSQDVFNQLPSSPVALPELTGGPELRYSHDEALGPDRNSPAPRPRNSRRRACRMR